MSHRTKRSSRRAARRPPASGRRPSGRLTARDSATCADELVAFHQQFQDLFARREQRQWSLFYLCGQLANLERKTIEPMVLALRGADPNAVRAVQQFIGHGAWDTPPLLARAETLVAQWLGEADGVVIVDGSGFPKQGPHSVGVAHQYCGHLGKVANCQQGVFLAYTSRRGYAFVDERLYLPADWFGEDYRARWQACGIPASLVFRTEPALGLEMLSQLVQRAQLPFTWVTCDEHYGKSPAFLDGIAALNKLYLAEVPRDTRVWLRTPPVEPPGRGPLGRPRTRPRVKRSAARPQELRELLIHLPPARWRRRVIKEGSKGPLVVEFAVLRVTPVRDELPGPRSWAVFRRTRGPQPEVKYYLSNAPASCALPELVRVSGLRWPVETALEEAKGEVGLDHYETRTWRGWHHHMAHAMLAHLFLVRLRLLFQKKSRADHRPGTPVDRARYRRRSRTFTRHLGDPPLSAAAQPCRLSFASQAHACSAYSAARPAPQTQSLVVISEVS